MPQTIHLLRKFEQQQMREGRMITLANGDLVAFEGAKKLSNGQPTKLFKCKLCPETFPTRQGLGGHVNSHRAKKKLLTHAGAKA
jgi:hypothetical protein